MLDALEPPWSDLFLCIAPSRVINELTTEAQFVRLVDLCDAETLNAFVMGDCFVDDIIAIIARMMQKLPAHVLTMQQVVDILNSLEDDFADILAETTLRMDTFVLRTVTQRVARTVVSFSWFNFATISFGYASFEFQLLRKKRARERERGRERKRTPGRWRRTEARLGTRATTGGEEKRQEAKLHAADAVPSPQPALREFP